MEKMNINREILEIHEMGKSPFAWFAYFAVAESKIVSIDSLCASYLTVTFRPPLRPLFFNGGGGRLNGIQAFSVAMDNAA